MNPIDFFTDLFNPDLAFLPKALMVAVISSIVCGVVGTHVVLRGMAFIGDAVSHAVFPGLAIAFVISGNLVLGGVFAGVATAVLVAVFSQNRRLNESSIIGVFFVAAFALGVVIISQAPGYAGSLEQFLFGSITGIPDSDLYVAGITGLAVIAVMFALHKEFVAISLDRESARALGVKVFWLDLVLYVLVTLAVVISVQTIGNILVLALLVTPAATARMLTDRLGVMMLLSPIIGGLGAFVGLYISWSGDFPAGGTIVLVLTAAFLVAWFFAPRQGLLVKAIRRARPNDGGEMELPTPQPVPKRACAAGLGAATVGASAVENPKANEVNEGVWMSETTPAHRIGNEDVDTAIFGAGTATTLIPAIGGAGLPDEPHERNQVPDGPKRRRSLLPVATGALIALGLGTIVTAAVSWGSADPSRNTAAERSAPTQQPAVPTTGMGNTSDDTESVGSQAPPPTGSRPGATANPPISQLADPDWVKKTASESDIPERALLAYAGASLAVAQSNPRCKIGWNTLAAIGLVESAHGTMNGATLDDRGVVTPSIVGVPLNGDGTAKVPDTDHGRYDGDTVWDHAVGPMQFIPSTWADAGQDGNKDGAKDVNQIDDAALATAMHLCDVGGDLSDGQNWIAAISAYNDSVDYNNEVADAANKYASLR